MIKSLSTIATAALLSLVSATPSQAFWGAFSTTTVNTFELDNYQGLRESLVDKNVVLVGNAGSNRLYTAGSVSRMSNTYRCEGLDPAATDKYSYSDFIEVSGKFRHGRAGYYIENCRYTRTVKEFDGMPLQIANLAALHEEAAFNSRRFLREYDNKEVFLDGYIQEVDEDTVIIKSGRGVSASFAGRVYCDYNNKHLGVAADNLSRNQIVTFRGVLEIDHALNLSNIRLKDCRWHL